MTRRAFALVILVSASTVAAAAQQAVDKLGPYTLGASYDSIKSAKGFEHDPSRDNAADAIKAARAIGPFAGQIAIQRFFFQDDKLVRLSVIFGDPKFTENDVRDLVAREWGDPGEKKSMGAGNTSYLWTGTRGIIFTAPADGGRWMAVLAANQ